MASEICWHEPVPSTAQEFDSFSIIFCKYFLHLSSLLPLTELSMSTHYTLGSVNDTTWLNLKSCELVQVLSMSITT